MTGHDANRAAVTRKSYLLSADELKLVLIALERVAVEEMVDDRDQELLDRIAALHERLDP